MNVPYKVTSDQRRLKQVIINLLSNALKFTNEGGVKVECSFDSQKSMLEISVNDTGIGIKKSD